MLLHDRADLLRAGAAASLAGGRAGGAREVEEVRALGVVELERVGERVEHAVGGAGGVAALQALVVLDADAGQRGDLLAAQPRHLAAAERAQPGLLGRDLRAAAGQELRELVGRVHVVQGTPAHGFRGVPCQYPSNRAPPTPRGRGIVAP